MVAAMLDELAGPSQPATRLALVFGTPVNQDTGAAMATILGDDQKIPATIAPKDARGNDARIDGVPVWSVGDSTILSLTVAPDGMSAEIAAVGPLGTTQVNVQADADLGSGITPIVGTADIEVVAGTAVTMGISLGTPVPQ